jgi:hypothetical protein
VGSRCPKIAKKGQKLARKMEKWPKIEVWNKKNPCSHMIKRV